MTSCPRRALVQQFGCSSCHETEPDSEQTTGPSLKQVGSVAASRRPGMSADEYIRESILDPYAYELPGYEGFHTRRWDRPPSRADLDALVAYLLSLK